MDPELVALTSTAATTLVKLLTTDGWERAKAGLGALWRRAHPDRADVIEGELVQARTEVLAADAASAGQLEQALVAEWQARLQRLLATNPGLAGELRRLLDEDLSPALPEGGRVWRGDVRMDAKATGHGRVYQVGQGDQHINER